MRKLYQKFCLLSGLLAYTATLSAVGQATSAAGTANDRVRPYTEAFQYGSNLGYYSGGEWDDIGLADIVTKAGGHSIRPTLPEYFVEKWGYTVRIDAFKAYADMGMKEITCFVGGPSEAHRDKTVYPGCTQSSKLFANLYEPIWKSDGSVNPANYYASYIYKLTKTYGANIRFWEVVNEPDYGYASPAAWLNRAPLPVEMVNTQAPFFHYIRMLRITWEVVKKYSPEDYVTTGGIGYPEYLDALLRYTDNPNGGAVSAAYPNKGGAYFDVLSFHIYPAHTLHSWDNSIGGFKFTRTSDYAAAAVIKGKDAMQSVLQKYGYNGMTYPQKHFLLTETNISRRTSSNRVSTDKMQRNFGIKSLVLAQKNGIKQLYFYGVGESVNAPASAQVAFEADEYKLMGLHENLNRDKPGAEKLTELGKGFKTTSQLVYGYAYDANRTAALNLPANVDGGAFSKNGNYLYVLWAKAQQDTKEQAAASYSFPTAWNMPRVTRYEWDYGTTGKSSAQSAAAITLSESPSFFTGASAVTAVAGAASTAALNSSLEVYPNPFAEYTMLKLNVATAGELKVEVYTVQGQLVKQVFAGYTAAGAAKTFKLEANSLPAGIYLVRASTNQEVITRKIIHSR